MRKDNKRDISDVLALLSHRDPDWANPKLLPKFKVLYNGWRTTELRHKIRAHFFYTASWKRGWLPIDDWNRFRAYVMQ